MTGSMQMLREFCDLLVIRDKATKTRIVCYPELFCTRTSFSFDKLRIKGENYVLSHEYRNFVMDNSVFLKIFVLIFLQSRYITHVPDPPWWDKRLTLCLVK